VPKVFVDRLGRESDMEYKEFFELPAHKKYEAIAKLSSATLIRLAGVYATEYVNLSEDDRRLYVQAIAPEIAARLMLLI
jgi:hypothetical protein